MTSTRRSLFRMLGGTALATAAGLALDGGEAAALSKKDADTLNFLLNVEYFLAEFYLAVIGEAPLGAEDISGTGTAGTTLGRLETTLTEPLLQDLAEELAVDEVAHVRFLRALLGNKKVAKPTLNLEGTLGLSYEEDDGFVTYARAHEDTAASAWGGAADLITNKTVAKAATRILATEAYHASSFRLHNQLEEVVQIELDLLDQSPEAGNVFPTDENGLAVVRTSSEVITILSQYFPSGFNGRIH